MPAIWSDVKAQLRGRRLVWNLLSVSLCSFQIFSLYLRLTFLYISYYVGQLLIFAGAYQYRRTDARLIALNKLTICFSVASASALVLSVDALILLLPTLRNIITIIRPALNNWLPVDEGFFLHKRMAYALLFWTGVHTSAHCEYHLEGSSYLKLTLFSRY